MFPELGKLRDRDLSPPDHQVCPGVVILMTTSSQTAESRGAAPTVAGFFTTTPGIRCLAALKNEEVDTK